MEDPMDPKTEPMDLKPESLELKPDPIEESHSADDVEWMAKKLMVPIPDLEELGFETFQWRIEDWRALDKRVTGPEFECGGNKWQVRILLFPQGNNTQEQVAVYLDSAEPQEHDTPNWHVCAQFALVMSNPSDPTQFRQSSGYHRFVAGAADWGFIKFVDFRTLEQTLLDNGSTTITAYVRVYKDPTGVLWQNFDNYDSKAQTGYVGFSNQGATCYMNSLLQSLFFTNEFRKSVFELPTETDDPKKSVSLALQRVFFQLMKSPEAVDTNELTQSFGWQSKESFLQHDVQEFNRVLQDRLETKMKGTAAEGAIQKLFAGKMKSYIKCINVDYESSRVEDFYDIQLNVKGCKTLEDSFRNYIDVETMDGENKYQAEGHGLQDARKGVIFESLPPVLHLQLKRFEYDMEHDITVKVNDRYEFPLHVDLAEFVNEGEEKAKIGEDGFKYSLHGVLVHAGDKNGGHYFALLKPERDGKWFKFDDDRVTPVTLKEVMEDNYGGVDSPDGPMSNLMRQLARHKKFTNAYMLVYIRDSSMEEVLAPVTDDDIPKHLPQRLLDERAAEEAARKAKEEALLYFNARVISDIDFKAHDGFDLMNPYSAAVGKLIKVRRQDTYATFREVVATSYGIPEDQLRLWTLVKRQNDTLRVDIPIPDTDLPIMMDDVRQKYGVRNSAELRCYVEFPEKVVAKVPNGKAWFQTESSTGTIMIFIKYYDPYTQTMEGLGKLFVPKNGKVGDIVGQLNEKKGLPANTPLKLFEEIKPTMIEPIKMKSTFFQCEIQGGDIIVFQKELTPKEQSELTERGLRVSIPQHFEYVFNRVTVEFKPKNEEDTSLPSFTLDLSKKNNYDDVTAKLGEKLGTNPLHLQLTTALAPGGLPKAPLRRHTNMLLKEMIGISHHQGMTPGIYRLYYEKLDTTIDEVESQKMIRVTWLGPTLKDESTHDLKLLKTSTMDTVVGELLPKVTLSAEGSKKLRLFSVFNGIVMREHAMTDSINSVHEQYQLYVEEIPQDELECEDEDLKLNAFHFTADINRTHSVPFTIVMKEGELFQDTKARIRARLGMNEKDFGKVKFYIYNHSTRRSQMLTDDLVLTDIGLSKQDNLALDHVDKSGRSNRFAPEKPIFIRG
ncbi:hypothetical protein BGZ83_000656 [Gryganskiella cystojenkinii]|nr:hypothetical protein BGZ83_000656 [Gryganskiella cystojenkinii]